MEPLLYWDHQIVLKMSQWLAHPYFDALMKGISALGNHGFLWITIGVVLLIFRKTRKWGLLILLSLGITAFMANVILKPLFARIRPFDLFGLPIIIPQPMDYSFPSGHTAAAFAAAFALCCMNRKIGIVAYIFAACMAFSRIYLLVHFPSDILGGIVVGTFGAWLAWKLLSWYNGKTAQKKENIF